MKEKHLLCGVDISSIQHVAYKGTITIFHQLPDGGSCDGCHLDFTRSTVVVNDDPGRRCVQRPAYTQRLNS